MSEQKIYVGGAKEINGNFGAFHRISFNKQDLETMLNNLNAKGYINLNMNKRREPSQYGQTHSLVVDTWMPNQNTQQNNTAYQQTNQFQQGQHPDFHPPVTVPPEITEPAMPSLNDFDDSDDVDDCPF